MIAKNKVEVESKRCLEWLKTRVSPDASFGEKMRKLQELSGAKNQQSFIEGFLKIGNQVLRTRTYQNYLLEGPPARKTESQTFPKRLKGCLKRLGFEDVEETARWILGIEVLRKKPREERSAKAFVPSRILQSVPDWCRVVTKQFAPATGPMPSNVTLSNWRELFEFLTPMAYQPWVMLGGKSWIPLTTALEKRDHQCKMTSWDFAAKLKSEERSASLGAYASIPRSLLGGCPFGLAVSSCPTLAAVCITAGHGYPFALAGAEANPYVEGYLQGRGLILERVLKSIDYRRADGVLSGLTIEEVLDDYRRWNTTAKPPGYWIGFLNGFLDSVFDAIDSKRYSSKWTDEHDWFDEARHVAEKLGAH